MGVSTIEPQFLAQVVHYLAQLGHALFPTNKLDCWEPFQLSHPFLVLVIQYMARLGYIVCSNKLHAEQLPTVCLSKDLVTFSNLEYWPYEHTQ
jgi:hypothetical protein